MPSTRRAAAYTAAASAAVSDGPVRFAQRITALPRLVRDVMLGRFTGLSRKRLLLMGLAVVYIVSPVDLLPEALLTLPGLADDAVVAGWLITGLLGATTAYLAWDDTPETVPGYAERVVPGEVVTP